MPFFLLDWVTYRGFDSSYIPGDNLSIYDSTIITRPRPQNVFPPSSIVNIRLTLCTYNCTLPCIFYGLKWKGKDIASNSKYLYFITTSYICYLDLVLFSQCPLHGQVDVSNPRLVRILGEHGFTIYVKVLTIHFYSLFLFRQAQITLPAQVAPFYGTGQKAPLGREPPHTF